MATESTGYTAAELRQMLKELIVELEERERREKLAADPNPRLTPLVASPRRIIEELLPELLARNNRRLVEDLERLGRKSEGH